MQPEYHILHRSKHINFPYIQEAIFHVISALSGYKVWKSTFSKNVHKPYSHLKHVKCMGKNAESVSTFYVTFSQWFCNCITSFNTKLGIVCSSIQCALSDSKYTKLYQGDIFTSVSVWLIIRAEKYLWGPSCGQCVLFSGPEFSEHPLLDCVWRVLPVMLIMCAVLESVDET